MISEPCCDSRQMWSKLTSQSEFWDHSGTVLCSYKQDGDLGHQCLLTEEEDSVEAQDFAKFRWTLINVHGTEKYYISNVLYGGRLYVSDVTFDSEEITMTKVYLRTASTCSMDYNFDRDVWHKQEMANGYSRFINAYNRQALCDTGVKANSKGDHWLGVTGASNEGSDIFHFTSQLVEVGS